MIQLRVEFERRGPNIRETRDIYIFRSFTSDSDRDIGGGGDSRGIRRGWAGIWAKNVQARYLIPTRVQFEQQRPSIREMRAL